MYQKMTRILLFVLITFRCLILTNSQDEAEVQRFLQLIQEGIGRANTESGLEDASEYIPSSEDITEFGKFDYIIVGAGSAGAVIANRLSAKPSNKVLLIEAGGHENEFSQIPAFYFFLFNSEYTWSFKTTPQDNVCLGMVDRQCTYFRGRGLGGTTLINGLNYIRGSRFDYDDWEAQGNPGWSYEDILPLFLKFENASFDFGNSTYHRRGGELNVEYEHPSKAPYAAFVQANIEQGQPFIDYNGPTQRGVGRPQFNTIQGRRDSAGRAFIHPILNRKNLKVMTYSYATKINIDKFTRTAYGVTFSHNKKLYLARAKREIIVSAGSFHTPQLLMLSGIGPAKHLRSLKIPLVQHLAVGANLQDHSGMLGIFFKINVTYPSYSLEEMVRQYLQGYGDLTFTFNSEGLSWFQTKFETNPENPDMEIMVVVSNVANDGFRTSNNFNNETFEAVYANIDPSNTFMMIPMALFPKSRGRITLNSANPYEFPNVDLGSFTDRNQQDLATMYEGIKIILRLIETEAFKQLNATLIDTTHPNCKKYERHSREYWYCQLEHLCIPFYHPVGTCKMGPDPIFGGAVVNHKLKVYGINKLRVADASIMPTIVGGHTSVPAMMIGEKLSELILSGN